LDNILWRQTQLNCYADEVQTLRGVDGNERSGRLTVAKQSHIYKLLPFMDEEGVLRMRGRIGAAAGVPYSAKYPVILPGTSNLAELIVERYHRVFRHANKETVVNEVRQHYQIPKMRTLINKVMRNCAYCKAMINTRPLTYIPVDPENQEALTPNHFLLGSSSGIKQQPVLPTNYRDGLKSNYKLAQHILDGMWGRWIKEYLPVITRQCKWFGNVREVKVGDLVLVVDGNVRNMWKRGIVERTISGADGRVRQAWVRTSSGTYRRPVAKLAVLEVVSGDHT
uniref:DUF5641 domain-containing protein n=1 Tax=Anopheles funestus TaxID=62324 RepID=A0A182S016_ANOFN